MPNKQDMLNRIYEVIGTNPEIKRVTYRWSMELMSNPVMIGDVLDWQYKTKWIPSCPKERSYIVEIWLERRQPIQEQPIECIEYIFNLLPKE